MIGLSDQITLRGIKIRVCCATCAHRVVDYRGLRDCTLHGEHDIDSRNRCDEWTLRECFRHVGRSEGTLRVVDVQAGIAKQNAYNEALKQRKQQKQKPS